jgi:putative thioredoxin
MTTTATHCVDINRTNFQSALVEASSRHPVVVNLWSTRSEPCKILTPILESIAESYGGAFTLAKVNADENQEIATMFQAQSIPMVVALFQGRPVDSFVGAKSQEQVQVFIDGVLTTCGVAIPEVQNEKAAPSEPAQAETHWRQKIEHNPDDGEAILTLARVLFEVERYDEAEAILGKLKGTMPQFGAGQSLLKLKTLTEEITDAGGAEALLSAAETDSNDPQSIYGIALVSGIRGDYVDSLAALVQLIASAPEDIRKQAKNAASILFDAAGRDNPEVENLRRKLARLLF